MLGNDPLNATDKGVNVAYVSAIPLKLGQITVLCRNQDRTYYSQCFLPHSYCNRLAL